MDQNVSASPSDADNLARKKPNAPTDATAPSGIDAAVAKAKASAQAAGRTEFMASNLSTVRSASRSDDPTPLSLPRLQPLVGVNPGAVDLTVATPGSDRVGSSVDPPPTIANVNWQNVAPPSGAEATVIVPPPNGSVSVEGTASGNSSPGKSAELPPVGINPSPPPALRVDFKAAGAPLPASTELALKPSSNLIAVTQTLKPPNKAAIAATEPQALNPATPITTVEPNALTTAVTTVALKQPVFSAMTAISASDFTTTGLSAPADQVPLRLNINFQPSHQSDSISPTGVFMAVTSPASTQAEVKAKALPGASAFPNDNSAHGNAPSPLALGQLFETSPLLSQTNLLASTGAIVPDAVITQYRGPVNPNSIAADASRLTGISPIGVNASLTRKLTLASGGADSTQFPLSATNSPYNVAFSATDISARPDIKSGTLPTGSDQLGQRPPLQLALANSVPLGATDYSVGTLPSNTTVSLRPVELNPSTSPLILQTSLFTPSADFHPTSQELSTTPIVISASIAPANNSLAIATEAALAPQAADLTQVATGTGRSNIQNSGVDMGALLTRDAGVVTATPVTLAAELLHTTGDITPDSRVALAGNTASANSTNSLARTVNFPLAFNTVDSTFPSGSIDVAGLAQQRPLLQTNDGARVQLVSLPLSTGETSAPNNTLIARPSIFDQSRETITLGSTASTPVPGQVDFSLTAQSPTTPAAESTLLTVAANSNTLYRPSSEVVAPTFQPGFDHPLGNTISVQTASSSLPGRFAEVSSTSTNANLLAQTNLSLGSLFQADEPVIKAIKTTSAANPPFATTNGTVILSRIADIPNLTTSPVEANLTTTTYIPATRSADPVQLALINKSTGDKTSNFVIENVQASGTFTFEGSRDTLANTNFEPVSSAQLPKLVTNLAENTPAVFYSGPALTTAFTPTTTSNAASVFKANDLITATPSQAQNLAIGSFLPADPIDAKPTGSFVAANPFSGSTLAGNPTIHTADITNPTNLQADPHLTAAIPLAKSLEPIQIASNTIPVSFDLANFASQRDQVAGSFSFDRSRDTIVNTSLEPVTNAVLPKVLTNLADNTPAVLYSGPSSTTALTASPTYPAASVFKANDLIIAPPSQAQTNLTIGSFLPADPIDAKPTGSFVAANPFSGTTLAGNPPIRTAEITNPTNLQADPHLTATMPLAKSLEPIQIASNNIPASFDLANFASQRDQVAGTFSFDRSRDTIVNASLEPVTNLVLPKVLTNLADNTPAVLFSGPSSTTALTAPPTSTSSSTVKASDLTIAPPSQAQTNLTIGSFLPADPIDGKPTGSLVAAHSFSGTTLEGNPTIRTAEISNPANLQADPNLTAAIPLAKSFEPIQVASSTKTTSATFTFDGSREILANASFEPVPTAQLPKLVTNLADNSPAVLYSGPSSNASFTAPHTNTAGPVFKTTDATIAPFGPIQANLAMGSFLPTDAADGKPSVSYVSSNSFSGTVPEGSPPVRTADIKYQANLPYDSALTATTGPLRSGEPIQLASVFTPANVDQSNFSTHGALSYQALTYGTAGTHDFSTSSTADAVVIPSQIKNFGGSGVENTVVASSSLVVPSSYDALPSQAKSLFSAANLNQTSSNEYATVPVPVSTTVNFRSSNGDSIIPPITVQVADLRGTAGALNNYGNTFSATDSSITASTKIGPDLSRSAVPALSADLSLANTVKSTTGAGQLVESGASSADAQNLLAKMGQASGRPSSSPEAVQTSGGYARLSTSALANTTALNGSDGHALPPTAQVSILPGLTQVMPLDGTNKTATGSLVMAAGAPIAGPLVLSEAPKGVLLSSNDRVTTTTLEPSLLIGSKNIVVADGKSASTSLDQTLHPVAAPGSAPALIGELGVRPVAANLILLDLTHAPVGPGGLDPSIKPAVTVVKPPETDLTGVKTVIVGQILTGRLPDGTALRPDPNGIIFIVKGAGAEVDPAGNRLLIINQKVELIGQTTTTGVVGTTTGIINGSLSEINIVGLTSTRAVRVGSDALVDSTHAVIAGNPAGLTVTASGKGNALIAGGANPDPISAAAAGLTATTPAGQAVPPNTAAGSPVAPLGSGNPDEDKNNISVAPGNTGVVVGNTIVPLPNLEFFDGKLSNTRIIATNRTEEIVNDTLVHGALPPLAGMDQTVSDILAARNGKQDPGIPNFDSNLSPISVFGDPKRFEPTGGIASTRFGDDSLDGKETRAGHRVDLSTEEGQIVDPRIHNNSTKEVDSSTIDSLPAKDGSASKSEVEEGAQRSPDASKGEDSEISDDVRNQITTLLTDQSENLTGVSDRRTVKDFIDELLHHTKRRSYRIDSGDTLEKLARRLLKDKRLAHLIYLLNEDVLGNQADLSNIQLRAGQVLIMPSIEDVLQYRIHILHDVMPPHIYKNIIDNPDERIVGSSKLLRATYSCRFGDRLTSIAARHSAIKDEKLWTVIAQLNGLSTLTDSSGQPKATLKRAQKLILPSRKDIEDHFRRSNHGAPAKVSTEIPSTPIINPDIAAVESVVRVPAERATVNWGDGDDLPTPLSALAPKDENGMALSNRELGPDSASKSGGKNGPTSKGPKSKPRRIAPNEARIVAPEDLGEGTEEIYLRLEFEYEGKWLPVIEYTGTKEQIYLHVYTLAGRTDSIPIALPTRSIRELAECDLGANYQRYCQRFLAGDRPI